MNYKIDAIEILLDKECVLEGYCPLIPFKYELINELKKENILTKEDAVNCDAILKSVLKEDNLVNLFKRFLNMYEINKSKLKEINTLGLSLEERKCFEELYLLPGVKATRARLYYLSSLKTLKDISTKTSKEIIDLTSRTIIENKLDCKPPLGKEANTHIAVAKLLTNYTVD